MADLYVGFYWTLPVNWAGFRDLPKPADAATKPADAAAKKSKTIRYQVERVRRHVAQMGGVLLDEVVFIEVSPDRGTKDVTHDLARACKLCADRGATLLYVDFAEEFDWRPHRHLKRYLDLHAVYSEPLDPHPIMIDGREFCPIRHFRTWRRRHEAKTSELRQTALAELRATAARFGGALGNSQAISDDLNLRGIRTTTGKHWTPDTVRKTLTRRGTMDLGTLATSRLTTSPDALLNPHQEGEQLAP